MDSLYSLSVLEFAMRCIVCNLDERRAPTAPPRGADREPDWAGPGHAANRTGLDPGMLRTGLDWTPAIGLRTA